MFEVTASSELISRKACPPRRHGSRIHAARTALLEVGPEACSSMASASNGLVFACPTQRAESFEQSREIRRGDTRV